MALLSSGLPKGWIGRANADEGPETCTPAQAGTTALPVTASASDQSQFESSLSLARDLLCMGPNGEDLKLEYLKVLIDNGLPKTTKPKTILIVGAGIAGMVSGWLLKQAGHQVTIIEANGNRVGGRIKTFRTGFADSSQYGEAGAMRLPDFHPMVLALIDKLGLKRRPFFLLDVERGTGNVTAPPPAVEYRSFNGQVWRRGPDKAAFQPAKAANQRWIATNGQRVLRSDYAKNPRLINSGFGLTGGQLNRNVGDLLDGAFAPVYDYFSTLDSSGVRKPKPVPEWVKGWARVINEFDEYSIEGWLRKHAGFSEEAIDAIGTIENLTSRGSLSFMHSFITRQIINPGSMYWEIEGGTGRLTDELHKIMKNEIRQNRRMTRIEYYDPKRSGGSPHVGPNGPKVWVETTTESGGSDEDSRSGRIGVSESFTADLCIITVPFSALRHVEVQPLFSYGKRRAITELHYDVSTKVLLEFKQRWWEGTAGGGSVTDNPNRFMYFPSHRVPGSTGGVVLASYSWADDALKWDSMDDDERYWYALRGMQAIYGDEIKRYYTGRGRTQSWLRNRYAFGEAAVFSPGQYTHLHPHIPTVEGPVHFAGEHTSLKHSWIEGSLESAVRSALEVNGR